MVKCFSGQLKKEKTSGKIGNSVVLSAVPDINPGKKIKQNRIEYTLRNWPAFLAYLS